LLQFTVSDCTEYRTLLCCSVYCAVCAILTGNC